MSDRIKKIKVKKADGSMTDYIPIGVDAENVDFDNGYKLNNIVGSINPDESGSIAAQLSKSIKYYDCVADMKADTTLNGGGTARTLGYYEPGDGGGAIYNIVEDNTLIDDGGSVHDLDNGLKAKIVIENNTVNLATMGLKTSNNKTMNTQIIYNTISKYRNNYTILIPIGTYNIDPIVIDFSTRYLVLKGMSKDAILQQVTSNDYALKFIESQSNITLEDIYIENNSIGSGISFESNSNSGSVHLNKIYIRNCICGYKLHNVVYLYANEANCGISGTKATENSFGYEIQGYEYNRMENCAAQINGNVSTYIDFPMCKILDTSYVWIKNCEFVKTGGAGIYIATTKNTSISHIYIDTCELFRVKEGIRIAPNIGAISNVNIINCHITNHGGSMGSTATDEAAINILHENGYESSNAKSMVSCNNLSVNRFGSSSPAVLIKLEDDIISAGSFTNIVNNYNNQANWRIGNNILSNLTCLSPKLNGTMSITIDGTTKSYNCIKNASEVPVMRYQVPKVVMTSNRESENALRAYPYYTYQERYETDSGRFRWVLRFIDTVPPAGTYKFDYKIIF